MKQLLIIFSVVIAPVLSRVIDTTPLENIQCVNSKLVVEEKPDVAHLKIVTDSQETLLDVDSKISNLTDFNLLFMELIEHLLPVEIHSYAANSTDYYIMKTKTDLGTELSIVNRPGLVLFNKVVPGLSVGDTKCANMHGYNLVVDPAFQINQQDGYNMTALSWACMLRLNDIAKDLVEKGADVNMESRLGELGLTPLIYAVATNNEEVVKLLISKGADVQKGKVSPLHIAAHKGGLGIAQMLIKHGASVNSVAEIERLTPLHIAAAMGKAKLAELLIKNGANVNVKSENGKTPLHMAIMNQQIEVCHNLLEAGADLSAKDNAGNSALMIAVDNAGSEDKALKVVEHLLAHHNPDVNVRNNKGETALSVATTRGFTKIQDLLKAKGAS